MKIQQVSDRPVYVLTEIKLGECFYFKDDEDQTLYMRCYSNGPNEDVMFTANLGTGEVFVCTNFNRLVEPVKASVQIEP